MNKITLFLLIIVALFLITACTQNKNFYTCKQDSDCISTISGCCNCNNGGRATAINKAYLTEWNKNLSKECKGMGCITAGSQHVSCFSEPKCVNNRCILVPSKEKICNSITSPYIVNCNENINKSKWNETLWGWNITCNEVFELCK